MKLSNGTWKSGVGALALALATMGADQAMAQSRPAGNEGLPRLEDIKPGRKPSQFDIHSVMLSVVAGYSRTRNKGTPALDQRSLQTTLGVSARFGQYFFGGVSGTFTDDDIVSTNLAFGLPMDASGSAIGGDAVIGFSPNRFLQFGLIGGVGQGDASYNFTGFNAPATPSDSTTTRFGGFASASYGIENWLLTGTASVLDMKTKQDYGPNNIPQFDTYGATFLMADVKLSHRLTEDLTVSGGVTLNQVLSQVIPAGQTGRDTSWLTIHGGMNYRLNEQVSLTFGASGWVGNDNQSFGRATLGAIYKF